MITTILITLYALIAVAVAISVYIKTPIMASWLKVIVGIAIGALWPLGTLAFIGYALMMAAPYQ